MIARRTTMLWAVLVFVISTREAYPCSISAPISNLKLASDADIIIRATAWEYASPPSNPQIWTTGVPDSKVRFKVIERIRGPVVSDLILPGYLVDRDDFIDQQPPYTFVRPGGRAGSCFANSYKSGGQFLLFLKKTEAGELTVDWYALAPVNEQLHADDDPWLLWVREHAQKAEEVPKTEPKPAIKEQQR